MGSSPKVFVFVEGEGACICDMVISVNALGNDET